MEECGWKDQVRSAKELLINSSWADNKYLQWADKKYVQVKLACRDVVKERGLDKITVEDLVQVLIS